MIKEVKSNIRVAKKGNAGGCISEIAFNNDNAESDCIEYAKKVRDKLASFETKI